MAITIPTELQITPKGSMLVPGIDVDPIGKALENTNYLYGIGHTPALASVMPIRSSGLTRDSSWTFAVLPSVDGLRYRFEHRIYSAANGNVSIKVESGRGDGPTSWTTIYATTAHAMTANAWTTVTHNGTIGSTEDRLRVTYTGAPGAYLPGHILVYPYPDTTLKPFASTWTVTSGFRAYDDGLLDGGATGRPVTTEMLDRCARNAIKVLRDRYQNTLSCVQEDGVVANPKHSAPSTASSAEGWVTVGRARGQLPGQKAAQMQIRAYGTVTGGSTAERIRVGIVGGPSVLLAADGTMKSTTLSVGGDGTLGQMLDWEVAIRATSGNTTRLMSVMAFWRPGD